MRIVTYAKSNSARVGVLDAAGSIWDVRSLFAVFLRETRKEPRSEEVAADYVPSDMVSFIERWHDRMALLHEALEFVLGATSQAQADGETLFVPAGKARILAAVLRPSKIVCVGNSYREHILRTAATRGIPPESVEIPDRVKVSFLKASSAVIGPGEPIRYPRESAKWDCEGELAIVIGKVCSHVSREKASEFIFGYTIMNDACIRDIPNALGGMVSPRAKSGDTFAPLGPTIATAHDLQRNPNELEIKTWVNEDLMQSATTADLLWPVEEIVSEVSRDITLWPGDIVATGSPPGVGLETNRYLKQGDMIKISIPEIGTLENQVGAPR